MLVGTHQASVSRLPVIFLAMANRESQHQQLPQRKTIWTCSSFQRTLDNLCWARKQSSFLNRWLICRSQETWRHSLPQTLTLEVHIYRLTKYCHTSVLSSWRVSSCRCIDLTRSKMQSRLPLSLKSQSESSAQTAHKEWIYRLHVLLL